MEVLSSHMSSRCPPPSVVRLKLMFRGQTRRDRQISESPALSIPLPPSLPLPLPLHPPLPPSLSLSQSLSALLLDDRRRRISDHRSLRLCGRTGSFFFFFFFLFTFPSFSLRCAALSCAPGRGGTVDLVMGSTSPPAALHTRRIRESAH